MSSASPDKTLVEWTDRLDDAIAALLTDDALALFESLDDACVKTLCSDRRMVGDRMAMLVVLR